VQISKQLFSGFRSALKFGFFNQCYCSGSAGSALRSNRRAVTLVEIAISLVIAVMVLSALYMLFGSGSRQAQSGTAKLEVHHRLRMVTEVLKDDLREAEQIFMQPGVYADVLKYRKFGGLVDSGGLEVKPRLTDVRYEFDPTEKRLKGIYGNGGELVNTQLFESAQFMMAHFQGRPFVRMKFEISDEEDRGKVMVYQTVGSRHINRFIGQRFWHSLKATRGEVFD
jgi:hypothetical protein